MEETPDVKQYREDKERGVVMGEISAPMARVEEDVLSDFDEKFGDLGEYSYATHDTPYRHGEYGECINCPIEARGNINDDVKLYIRTKLAEAEKRGAQQERRFIEIILDGIEEGNRQMGESGATQAIRYALSTRIIK